MSATGEIASNGMAQVWESFPIAPESAGHARKLAGDALAAIETPDDATYRVTVLISELVTNALVHGAPRRPGQPPDPGETIDMLLRADDRLIHIEITDPGRGGQPQIRHDLLAEGGRGLILVQKLASDWGHDVAVDGAQTVWCEVKVRRDPTEPGGTDVP